LQLLVEREGERVNCSDSIGCTEKRGSA